MMKIQEKDTIQSINKIPLLLDLFSDYSILTLHEIHLKSGLSKTSALRLCNSLINIGFLERFDIGGTPNYRLGVGLYKLGKLAIENIDIHEQGRKYLNHISQEIGDNSYLFIERNRSAVCIDNVKGNYYIQTNTTNIGDILPFNKGGAPTAMLAYYPLSKQQEIIEGLDLSKEEVNHLLRDLTLTKERGYSFSIGQVYEDTAAIGTPIFDIEGNVAGALSIGAIASRFSQDRIPFLTEVLKKYARELSKEMGHNLTR